MFKWIALIILLSWFIILTEQLMVDTTVRGLLLLTP